MGLMENGSKIANESNDKHNTVMRRQKLGGSGGMMNDFKDRKVNKTISLALLKTFLNVKPKILRTKCFLVGKSKNSINFYF